MIIYLILGGSGVKYLFPGDELILVKESQGHGSERGNCTPASKTFAHSKTREQIVLSGQLDKVKPCEYTEI